MSPSVAGMGLVILLHLSLLAAPALSLDFLFNSFAGVTNLTLIKDARVDVSVIRMTNDSNQYSYGRAFYPTKVPMKAPSISSFSTSFVFSILPQIPTSPGFGLAFLLCNTTDPPGALASQYFGLFTNATSPSVFPLIAVEFDTGQNPEFNDIDDNHIGIDLNNIESTFATTAGYYNSSGGFVPVRMRTGQNIRAWIEFDGESLQFNVTVAPVGVSRPSTPTLTYRHPAIANYVSADMYVGFSASKTNWIEAQRVLAWSFSDSGPARELNTTNLPVFEPESSSSSLSGGAIAGIVIGCFVFVLVCASGFYLWWRNNKGKEDEDEEIEDWELEYWPHRFSYEELSSATREFRKEQLLGSGGFGRVYRGTLPNNTQIAVKCVNHDSKQGCGSSWRRYPAWGGCSTSTWSKCEGGVERGTSFCWFMISCPMGVSTSGCSTAPRSFSGGSDGVVSLSTWQRGSTTFTTVGTRLLFTGT
ncbi:L-type lectin-domain containing receptor kinase S.1 [Spatholobus suberectus]|nr:L-type lectin-domain containing receptor kinase S.1 [Spatholobus suberectus]